METESLKEAMVFNAPESGVDSSSFVETCSESFLANGAVVINSVFSPGYLGEVNDAYRMEYGNIIDASREVGDKRTMASIELKHPCGCYLFDARLLHGGTANYSQAERPVLYLTYCRPWWRDSTNFRAQKPLIIRPEVLVEMPSELQSMFRYAS